MGSVLGATDGVQLKSVDGVVVGALVDGLILGNWLGINVGSVLGATDGVQLGSVDGVVVFGTMLDLVDGVVLGN